MLQVLSCHHGSEFAFSPFEMSSTLAMDNDLVCQDFYWTIIIDEFFMVSEYHLLPFYYHLLPFTTIYYHLLPFITIYYHLFNLPKQDTFVLYIILVGTDGWELSIWNHG